MEKLSGKFNLKNDFPELSLKEWKEIVTKELKGVPFEKQLITGTYEGIDLSPIYASEDVKDIPLIYNYPGFFNFVRGTGASGYNPKSWLINQELPYFSPEEFNEALRYDLDRGQNSVNIILDEFSLLGADPGQADINLDSYSGLSVACIDDFIAALDNIDLYRYPVIIESGFSPFPIMPLYFAYLKKKKYNIEKTNTSFSTDPIGYSVRYGGFQNIDYEEAFNNLASSIHWVKKNNINCRLINCNGLPFTEAGAGSVQELGYVMAAAIEYLNKLFDRKISTDDIAGKMIFTFGTGSNYFMEIAKLRAARILISTVLKSFGCSVEKSNAFIHARSLSYNKTKYDMYVNILRTTTETFSAIVGGADSIHTSRFDETLRLPDEFSRRVARNTQLILREESHLDNVIDPAGGSYYVEFLTAKVASKAWELVKEIEKNGGLIEALKKGMPQEDICKTFKKRENDLKKRKTVIVGNNFYSNVKENEPLSEKNRNIEFYKRRDGIMKNYRKKKNEVAIEFKKNIAEDSERSKLIDLMIESFIKGATIGQISGIIRISDKKEVIKPLKSMRASVIFEELRNKAFLYKKSRGESPSVFLITIGPAKQHKARSDYSRSFFEIGGFNVIYEKGFNSVIELSESVIYRKTDIFVICSTDDTYPELVPEIVTEIRKTKKDAIVVLAGNPKDKLDEYKDSGIDEFIYDGVDAVNVLNRIFDRLK